MSDYSFSFSGSDCHTFVSFMSPSLYGDNTAAAKIKLDCINTISISVHEQRTPVRRLGHSGVVGFAGSIRTVAGSIIMTIIKDNPFDELIKKSGVRSRWGARVTSSDSNTQIYSDVKHPYNYKGYRDSYEYTRTNNSPTSSFNIQNLTTLPAMKFRMEFVSEYYRAKKQPYRSYNLNENRPLLRVIELHNVFIISENIVTSVNNMVTELVLQYVASDYVEFSEENTSEQKAQAIKEQVAPVEVTNAVEKSTADSKPVVEPVVSKPAEPTSSPLFPPANNPEPAFSLPNYSSNPQPSAVTLPATTTKPTAVNTIPQTQQTEETTVEEQSLTKTGSATIPVAQETKSTPRLYIKDYADLLKTNFNNADDNPFISEIIDDASLIQDGFKNNQSLQNSLVRSFKKELEFDFNKFKNKHYPNKAISDSNNNLSQPSLEKEKPFFQIAAMVEKNPSPYRTWIVDDGDSYYDPDTMNVTSIGNMKTNLPLPDYAETTYYSELADQFKESNEQNYKTLSNSAIKAQQEMKRYDQTKAERKSFETPENALITYNAKVMFDSTRNLNEQEKFLNHVFEYDLIPNEQIHLYTDLAARYFYKNLQDQSPYSEDGTVAKDQRVQAKKAANEHFEKYIAFLTASNQMNDDLRKQLIADKNKILDSIFSEGSK